MSKLYSGKMIAPALTSKFQCSGPGCPDTCCTGWRVDVDRESYNSLMASKNPTIKPLQCYLVLQHTHTERAYARLAMNEETQYCAILTPEKSCSIHSELGDKVLPDVCFTYPRVTHQIGQEMWQSMYLSCCEAARLALTDDDAFSFVESMARTRTGTIQVLTAKDNISVAERADLRLFAIQLLTAESLPVINRMILLGWLAQQVDLQRDSGMPLDAAKIIQEISAMLDSGATDKIIDALPRDPEVGASVFALLFAQPGSVVAAPRQKDFMKRVAAGLDLQPGLSSSQVGARFEHGLAYYDQAPGLLDRILGRSVLSEALVECFPWGASATAMEHFRRHVIRFGVLRLALAGLAEANGGIPEQEALIEALYLTQRIYQHRESFARAADKVLNDLNCHDLDRLFLLLK